MKAWKDMMKKENLVVLLILGLLLLVLALPTEKTDRQNAKKEVETAQTGTAENWQQEMERQLQEILEQVEGVGETRVFLACQSSSRKIVEKDETETVYEKDAKGKQQPYVASEEYPGNRCPHCGKGWGKSCGCGEYSGGSRGIISGRTP